MRFFVGGDDRTADRVGVWNAGPTERRPTERRPIDSAWLRRSYVNWDAATASFFVGGDDRTADGVGVWSASPTERRPIDPA